MQSITRSAGSRSDRLDAARRGGLGRRHLGPGDLVVRAEQRLHLDAFDPDRFDIIGIVPVAYALFAMALGIAAGTLLRRTLPAMAITFARFVAARAVIAHWLRRHYMSAVTAISR